MASLVLAALAVLAAARAERGGPRLRGALGAYALAAIGALSLAATMELREAWLTVALAAQLPADIKIEMVKDESVNILDSVNDVQTNIIIGISTT